MKKRMLILTVFVIGFARPAGADVIVGPYTFADDALVDDVAQVAGTPWDYFSNGYFDGTSSHPWQYTVGQMLASQWDEIVLLGVADIGADMLFEARFIDNQVVNGPGADLVLFDLMAPDANGYVVAIATDGGYTSWRAYQPPVNDIGVENPYWWWGDNGAGLIWLKARAIEIDLSDFGLAEGGTASAFRFRGDEGADPLGAAALHSAAPLATKQTTWGAVKALYR